jgi:hypothetical protein
LPDSGAGGGRLATLVQRLARNRAIHRLAELVPASVGSNLQRLPRPLTFGLVGPFNNQRMRVAAVDSIFAAVPFTAVIETGTHRGLTTLHLRDVADGPIATIEVDPAYHDYARRRIESINGDMSGISVFLGESPAVLQRLGADPAWTSGPTFFYLDAHWRDHLPLADELRAITAAWRDFAALIDDFQVPDDPGYGYDDYGRGKRLALPLLEGDELAGLHLYWPAARSSVETGARRGWALLASPGRVADALDGLPELRPGGVLPVARAASASNR